jgi:Ca2+-binding EF-hand superfamily protein
MKAGKQAFSPAQKKQKWVTDTTATKMAIEEILGRSAAELAEFLVSMDADKSGKVDKREFIRGFNSLYGARGQWATDKLGAGIIFDSLDTDGSGTLEIGELRKYADVPPGDPRKPRRGASKNRETLPAFKIDVESNLSVSAQLREYLRKHGKRVLDLFKSWDDDDDQHISRDEFGRAMTMLGVRAHPIAIKGLFNAFDADGSGEISYMEFEKGLLKKDVYLDLKLTPQEDSAMRKLARASGGLLPKESNVLALCEALGYPTELNMSLDEFLTAESAGGHGAPYMSMAEAQLEHALHRLMPLRDADAGDADGSLLAAAAALPQDVGADGTQGHNAARWNARTYSSPLAGLHSKEKGQRMVKAAADASAAAGLALTEALAKQIVSSPPPIISPSQLRQGSPPPRLPRLLFDPPPTCNIEVPGVGSPPTPSPSWAAQVNAHWEQWGERRQRLHDQRERTALGRCPWDLPADLTNQVVSSPFYHAQQLKKQQEWHDVLLAQSKLSPAQRAREAIDALHQSTIYRSPNVNRTNVLRHALTRPLNRSPSLPAPHLPHESSTLSAPQSGIPSTLMYTGSSSSMLATRPAPLEMQRHRPSVQLSASQRHAQRSITTTTPDAPQPDAAPLIPKLTRTLTRAATAAQEHMVRQPHRPMPMPRALLETSFPYNAPDEGAPSIVMTTDVKVVSYSVPVSPATATSSTSFTRPTLQRPQTWSSTSVESGRSRSLPALLPSQGRLGRREAPFVQA